MNGQTEILADLRRLILETIDRKDVRLYLFGSWARQQQKQSSDIDVAIEASPPLSREKWLKLQEKVEESSIPYRVDLVDMEHADPALKANIKKEGIRWTDSSSGSSQQNVL